MFQEGGNTVFNSGKNPAFKFNKGVNIFDSEKQIVRKSL